MHESFIGNSGKQLMINEKVREWFKDHLIGEYLPDDMVDLAYQFEQVRRLVADVNDHMIGDDPMDLYLMGNIMGELSGCLSVVESIFEKHQLESPGFVSFNVSDENTLGERIKKIKADVNE